MVGLPNVPFLHDTFRDFLYQLFLDWFASAACYWFGRENEVFRLVYCGGTTTIGSDIDTSSLSLVLRNEPMDPCQKV